MSTHLANQPVERGETIAERDYMVDEIDLFLFSAACWLPHRIHYDQAFARTEGHEAVPVHGPLQATWLIQLATEWATERGLRIKSSTVRHLNSAYPRQQLCASVTVESVSGPPDDPTIVLELQIARPDGSPVTIGSATAVTANGSADRARQNGHR
jgi:hydroxyacyl-ACP dehydratase HTD2-like protein with hotdog domain